MTIRGRLNLAVTAFIGVFLVAGGFAIHSVNQTAAHTQRYGRLRESGQLTSDIRTAAYQHVAVARGVIAPPVGYDAELWMRFWIEDADVQIYQATDDRERELWSQIRESLESLGRAVTTDADSVQIEELLASLDAQLRMLRSLYNATEYTSLRNVATAGFAAQKAVGVACLVSVLMLLLYLIMIRHWLVRPLELLHKATDEIGSGRLDHTVPLEGNDEFAQLARRVETMASRLARHQAELLESRELSAIGELCANVAHGLRNPLAALRASAQLARRRAAGLPEAAELIREILAQVDRMDARISRLFEFSRPAELRRRCIHFVDLTRMVGADTDPLLRTRSIELQIDDHCGTQALWLDPEQIATALAELVTNAVHHSADGAVVSLRGEIVAHADGRRDARFLVLDHGTGMAAATAEKAFLLFFTSRAEGSGMGLALVKRAVERHGGEVAIQSALGAGTTVTITLPLIAEIVDPGNDVQPIRGRVMASTVKALPLSSPGGDGRADGSE